MNAALPSRRIVVATPHARHDALLRSLARALPEHEIVRVREREELSPELLAPLAPEYVFLPHWSWLVPPAVHERHACVIFHMTDLPYGRGGSPLQNLVVRGHRETMMTALRCVAEMDAGPVYLKRPLSLDGTAEQILVRASTLIGEMIVEIVARRPEPLPQRGEPVLFKRRRPQDGSLLGIADPAQAYDWIRMLDADGYPRAFLDAGALRLEFEEARLDDDEVVARVRIRRRRDA